MVAVRSIRGTRARSRRAASGVPWAGLERVDFGPFSVPAESSGPAGLKPLSRRVGRVARRPKRQASERRRAVQRVRKRPSPTRIASPDTNTRGGRPPPGSLLNAWALGAPPWGPPGESPGTADEPPPAARPESSGVLLRETEVAGPGRDRQSGCRGHDRSQIREELRAFGTGRGELHGGRPL